MCVCEGINGQTYVISLDGYALKLSPLYSHACSVCVFGGGGGGGHSIRSKREGTKYSQL